MRYALAVLAALALVTAVHSAPAFADDSDGALYDGGAIVTSTDGGSTVVARLRPGALGSGYTMATRCEGAQSTRYTLCATSSCAAAAGSQLLDYDVTQDIGVNRPGTDTAKQYIALRTDDAGVPRCLVHVNR